MKASATLSSRIPIDTASRWDECQSSEWKRDSPPAAAAAAGAG